MLEAENGRRAILLSERQIGPIDLMLTDIVMPGMNGLVLAEKMISSRTCNAVLYMSGYTGNATGQQEEIPADALLVKPFTPERLLDKVRLVLDSSEQTLNRNARD